MSSVTAVMPHVHTKRLVALAVTSPKRSPVAPEVSRLVELGVKGVEAPSWYAIVAAAATTPEQFANILQTEYDTWGKIIRSIKVP